MEGRTSHRKGFRMTGREGVRPEHWELAGRDASLGVGHTWTNVRCAAYRTLDPDDCTCVADWERENGR